MDGVILDPFGPFQSAPGRCHCGAKKGARQAGTHECPVSEVRDTPQHTLTRTSETKGHSQLYGSRAAFDLKFLTECAAGGVGTSNRRHECPVSEVRDTPQHTLTRTSETKGHSQLYGSRAAFDLKFLTEFAAGGVGTSNRRHERFAEPNCARKSVRPPPSARLRIPWQTCPN